MVITSSLEIIQALASSVTELTIHRCKELTDLSVVPDSLTHLSVIDCPNITETIGVPTGLVTLELISCGLYDDGMWMLDLEDLPEEELFCRGKAMTELPRLPMLEALILDRAYLTNGIEVRNFEEYKRAWQKKRA